MAKGGEARTVLLPRLRMDLLTCDIVLRRNELGSEAADCQKEHSIHP